jgi:GDPmannose 4,6-dehydratase
MTAESTTGRTALITGIAGQDGSYLAELLLSKGYRVVGVHRPGSPDLSRIAHLLDRLELCEADLLDEARLVAMLDETGPNEVYNLAGHSFVPTSWDQADLTGDATGLGAVRMLEAIRVSNPGIRFYQASTSEIFGNAASAPQDESTPLNPRNPYGAAKAFAHFSTGNARVHHGLFAVCGILYNHESPRRGAEFVTRKITSGTARISLGLADSLTVGSLDARRDWGFAGDYVDAIWRMLQQADAEDYVVATGVLHTVRDLCAVAFQRVGLDFERYVRVDQSLARPLEAVPLVGNASKARRELGWEPTIDFRALIETMVDADVERERHRAASDGGR